jgi:pyrophosphate--fructose-6-phosphate 1-phosphotransferase
VSTSTPGTRPGSARRVALLTAGGLAPCLSSAVGGLVERYTELAPEIEIIGYLDGYAGLLAGRSVPVTPEVRAAAGKLHRFGGSPLGNSRVKLTNTADLVRRGLIAEGRDPLAAAAEQLTADGVDVLHTIGGDDTNTTAADLARHLADTGRPLTVVGLPKTVDNDVVPIRQTLGAWTAAEQGAVFARNIVSEHTSNPRMLLVHEIMGRNCGWLTAATARAYRQWLAAETHAGAFVGAFGHDPRTWDVHGVFLPELEFDVAAETERLRATMDELGCVTLFVSEGAGVETIVAELERTGEEVQRDPFGHVKLDTVNPGAWFARQFAAGLGAEKTMVQKSGYFSRSAAPNAEDLRLIKSCTDFAVDCALRGEAGVVGHDEDHGGRLRAIEFDRIRGGRRFDATTPWFADLLADIGQARPARPARPA